jgi:hypothetical protein
MKYIANPVEVDAFKILEVCGLFVRLEEKEYWENITLSMVARMTPKVGDYYVVQSDGYVYLNTKEVFERKYSRMELPT